MSKRTKLLLALAVAVAVGLACVSWYLASCGGDWFTPTTCGSGR